MSEARQAVHWRLTGRVQGVSFRWFTRRAALELGADGWVRNLGDGSVEVEASAPRDALDELRLRLRRGPSHARVDRLEERSIDPSTVPEGGFEIRY